jgi:hypothetical protein
LRKHIQRLPPLAPHWTPHGPAPALRPAAARPAAHHQRRGRRRRMAGAAAARAVPRAGGGDLLGHIRVNEGLARQLISRPGPAPRRQGRRQTLVLVEICTRGRQLHGPLRPAAGRGRRGAPRRCPAGGSPPPAALFWVVVCIVEARVQRRAQPQSSAGPHQPSLLQISRAGSAPGAAAQSPCLLQAAPATHDNLC